MPYYATRSLIVYKLVFNVRNKPNEIIDVNDLSGRSLHTLFQQFCEEAKDTLIPAKGHDRFLKLSTTKEIDGGCLIRCASGLAGEDTEIVDIETGETIFNFDGDKAALVTSRCYIPAFYSTGYALICIEHTKNGAGDTAIFGPFKKFLATFDDNIVMQNPEAIMEHETIDAMRSIDYIELQHYLEPSDRARLLFEHAKSITVKIAHEKNKPFPLSVIDSIRNQTKPISLFGLDENTFNENNTDVFVAIKNQDGYSRKFSIDCTEFDIKARETLNHSGEPPLVDKDFVRKCNEKCQTFHERLGRTL